MRRTRRTADNDCEKKGRAGEGREGKDVGLAKEKRKDAKYMERND